uniref:Major facilitator superfamily (MFS) profile domain-containing protein n=1 Tax=Phlebotomus papatasi TaxID=29031 RepID=A0A1B0DDT6_PHLPP
ASAEFRVYKRRWIVLAIFCLYSASNALQWIQYSIIANIVQRYYGITSTWVDWTSMIYMVLYIPLITPASWILDKMGLRFAAICGVLGTCLGAWIKVFSVQPDLFYVSFIGQSIVATSQVKYLYRFLSCHFRHVWLHCGLDPIKYLLPAVLGYLEIR